MLLPRWIRLTARNPHCSPRPPFQCHTDHVRTRICASVRRSPHIWRACAGGGGKWRPRATHSAKDESKGKLRPNLETARVWRQTAAKRYCKALKGWRADSARCEYRRSVFGFVCWKMVSYDASANHHRVYNTSILIAFFFFLAVFLYLTFAN